NCKAGHVTMTANNSVGIGTFSYFGSAIDLSAYTGLFFDWGADLPGASVDIIFHDASTSQTVASWSSLANTGGSSPAELITQATMMIVWGSLDSAAITQIDFVVNGVANMDTIIDNITAVVPVPAAVWLFGSGLLGLAGVARRRKR
ncbi:MAG TPA: VPLPA-CTERM sorting domain-containing protein, partial [Gammaproteobacteria bacterium]|nr:VPLPA-CTERM sorting domain-containing protein [Gammaproteobacteria bacterium]